ncbi:Protein of unknown function [Gryllus bimaculatus]|nr:Protein of unknown function [Gryllus bimaculatus]
MVLSPETHYDEVTGRQHNIVRMSCSSGTPSASCSAAACTSWAARKEARLTVTSRLWTFTLVEDYRADGRPHHVARAPASAPGVAAAAERLRRRRRDDDGAAGPAGRARARVGALLDHRGGGGRGVAAPRGPHPHPVEAGLLQTPPPRPHALRQPGEAPRRERLVAPRQAYQPLAATRARAPPRARRFCRIALGPKGMALFLEMDASFFISSSMVSCS